MRLGASALVFVLCLSSRVLASGLLGTPFGDRAPWHDAKQDSLRTAAAGWPDVAGGARLSAISLAARRQAEHRGRRALEGTLQAQAQGAGLAAERVAALLDAMQRHTKQGRVRPLADGGVVLELAVPCESLRAHLKPGMLCAL